MSKSFDKAIEKCKELTRWRVSPYRCLFHNPKKYSLVEFARWAQRYSNYKIYQTLLSAANITGYEPVPAELLNRNYARDNLLERKIKAGRLSFYLIKPDEMSKSLLERYKKFRNAMTI